MPSDFFDSRCNWNKVNDFLSTNLQCVLTYCTNATTDPNAGQNYNLVMGGGSSDMNYNTLGKFQDRTPLGKLVIYPCLQWDQNSSDAYNAYRLENNTNFKSQADGGITVLCGTDGLYKYPSAWPQCSQNVTCQDPATNADVQYAQIVGTPTNFTYMSQLSYNCKDKRKYVKITSSSDPLSSAVTSTCLWRKLYNVTASSLTCTLHHCAHPYNDNGSFAPPPPENNLLLVEDARTLSSFVPFGSSIVFNCSGGTYIESNQTDPTQTQVFVQCLTTVATYSTPTITNTYVFNLSLPAVKTYQPGLWPNCTGTVRCGQPPAPTVNGSLTWINSPDLQVQYCVAC